MRSEELASYFVNEWLKDSAGLPITLQLTRLGLALVELIDCLIEDDEFVYPRRDEED